MYIIFKLSLSLVEIIIIHLLNKIIERKQLSCIARIMAQQTKIDIH